MAQAPIADTSASATDAHQNKNYLVPLIILATLFFMWGFLTSLNDILIPYFKKLFELNYTQALLIQFCFFAAYGVCSIPSGTLVKRIGYQRGAVIGLTIAAVGCFLFVPAANQLSYNLFLGALFVLAAGITLLQVSANPYVAQLGPAATAPRRLTLTQAFNSLGAFLGPKTGAVLLLGAAATQLEMSAEAVKMPYVQLGVALLVMAVVFFFIKLPKLNDDAESGSYVDSLKYRHLVLGVIAIFVYVGAEVSIGSLIINFMADPLIAGMPEAEAASFVSYYWGLALIGRFVGVALMFVISGNRMLLINALCAVALLVVAITTEGQSAYIALVAVGFFNSLMFPTIFSLAIAKLGPLASRGSGLLCTAIIGGALIPLAQGIVADTSGLQISFVIPAVCYLYIAFYGATGWQPKGPALEQG
ncbi:sugar MFS transporter [Arenicella xantha]|uniref:FHS family L-fucose permease-like MFS transporter n=1 Tax=Arenicella xantha TaxID=644221 RepID=A0A395JI94_9GAMM|nr:sugar MFS transporter [Arenicella xantha]RBP49745.1 FHS family L-fucose permease-like MFS transporter [Arenicella xantha]